ncbi:MAG: hypothetical protein AAF217_06420 [Pseudomonadota bacterium]
MSDLPMERSVGGGKADFVEALVYRLVVLMLLVVSGFAIAIARLSGRSQTGSFWQEVRQTAHAVAGYAFKY